MVDIVLARCSHLQLPAVDTDETESRYADRLVRRQVQSRRVRGWHQPVRGSSLTTSYRLVPGKSLAHIIDDGLSLLLVQ
jgi:hypothetical protein